MVANKSDLAPEGSAGLSTRLGLERLEGHVSRVQPASALSGAGVRDGLQWLVEQVTLLLGCGRLHGRRSWSRRAR